MENQFHQSLANCQNKSDQRPIKNYISIYIIVIYEDLDKDLVPTQWINEQH